MAADEIELLAKGVREADPDAIADALAQVEDMRPDALAAQRALLRRLEEDTPEDHAVVGLTGPPGAGKSSLAAALIRHWLDADQGVGMVAVDPSSRVSGGALLGDRARVRFAPGERVFLRSMAARDRLGGLAPATRAAVVVLRAAYPWTVVETVGVGQSEVDIASVADTVALVLQPGSGDTLQFMKAGILEIPDVFVVHKWDLGEPAERTQSDLESMLALGAGPGGEWTPPVIGVSAHTGEGVPALAEQLSGHGRFLASSGERGRRRSAGRVAWALELFSLRYGTLGLERIGGRDAAAELAQSSTGTALDAYAALAERARS